LIFEQQGDYVGAVKIYETGRAKCPNCLELNERLSLLNSQIAGHRKYGAGCQLIDIDDSKFIVPPPVQFANEYMAAVPQLPGSCYGVNDVGDRFAILTTFPRSIFAP
jgi:hypothetical protein